jgi:hypothetical protein
LAEVALLWSVTIFCPATTVAIMARRKVESFILLVYTRLIDSIFGRMVFGLCQKVNPGVGLKEYELKDLKKLWSFIYRISLRKVIDRTVTF